MVENDVIYWFPEEIYHKTVYKEDYSWKSGKFGPKKGKKLKKQENKPETQ